MDASRQHRREAVRPQVELFEAFKEAHFRRDRRQEIVRAIDSLKLFQRHH